MLGCVALPEALRDPRRTQLACELHPEHPGHLDHADLYSDLAPSATLGARSAPAASLNVVAAVDHDHLFGRSRRDALDALVLLSKNPIFRENAGC